MIWLAANAGGTTPVTRPRASGGSTTTMNFWYEVKGGGAFGDMWRSSSELLGEAGDETRRVFEALDLREVPCLGNQLEARTGDALRVEARVVDINDPIGLSPGEQRRR